MGVTIVSPTSCEAVPKSVPRATVPALHGLTVGFLSRQVLAVRGADALGLAVVAHPVGGIPQQEAFERITPLTVDDVVLALTTETERCAS